MRLEGIHHITAITGDAPRNVDFYTRVLGLRLVAKTVNQDDPSVYHLFYADEQGRPGAELTFFEYPRAIPGRAGAGMVHRIVSRVGSRGGAGLLGAAPRRRGRRARARRRCACASPIPRASATSSWCAPAATPRWRPSTPRSRPSSRCRASTACARTAPHPEHSGVVLEQLLGATALGDDTWELRGERRGGTIAYDAPPAEPGRQSAGTVHHVAWGTTVAEHPRWEELLRGAGVPTSGIVDRHYFHSIYFREPSGVLFEIADDGPGFTVDGYSIERAGIGDHPAAAPRARPRAHRGDPDPAARSARAAQPSPLGFAVRRIAYSIGAPLWGAQPGNAPASCRRPASVIGSVDATQAKTRSPGT